MLLGLSLRKRKTNYFEKSSKNLPGMNSSGSMSSQGSNTNLSICSGEQNYF